MATKIRACYVLAISNTIDKKGHPIKCKMTYIASKPRGKSNPNLFYPKLLKSTPCFVCFVYSGPRPSPVMGCPYSGILTSSPRGWRVCNTPSAPEGTLSTPRWYREGPGRIPSQVREGSYGQFNPNTT